MPESAFENFSDSDVHIHNIVRLQTWRVRPPSPSRLAAEVANTADSASFMVERASVITGAPPSSPTVTVSGLGMPSVFKIRTFELHFDRDAIACVYGASGAA